MRPHKRSSKKPRARAITSSPPPLMGKGCAYLAYIQANRKAMYENKQLLLCLIGVDLTLLWVKRAG